MASLLVPVADMAAYLGDFDTDDADATAVLTALIDDVEAMFLADCGRPERAFAAADVARVEVHDGTGTGYLFLQRNVMALTSVVLGLDTAVPDDTLDVADKTELAWQVGSNRLVRTDGGIFGYLCVPDYVHVTYSASVELPRDAALAVTQATAMLWRRMGSEEATSERIGPYSADFAKLLRHEPLWAAAVSHHREIHV